MSRTAVANPHHLVDDEVVTLSVGGERAAFRLRVWRAAGLPAVVVASGLDGNPPPAVASARLANAAYRRFLGFLPEGMDYFEVNRGGKAYAVTFEAFGHHDRITLTRPLRFRVDPCEIFALVGRKVEL